MPPKSDWEKYEGNIEDNEKKEKIVALDEGDIKLLTTYGQGPYTKELKTLEQDLKDIQKRVNEHIGVKESDTGLAAPNLWDIPADKQRMQEEQPLQVARCTKIIQGENNEDPKYVINVKQIAKFVVELVRHVSPTDIEEGMRVGVDRTKYQIQIPLPPKIDPSVTMMQVEEKPDVTYSDVGGCKEQIERLREVVELPLLQPERFVNLGIDPPKGVLLYGPPGTGKTLCARAVANRTDATFIRVIGSELVQKYVGEGARMVRELFEMARTKKACIIFFDEVDAIGGARFDDGAGGDNEVQRTMLELINQLDGFDPRGNIKVLMATNRPDTLDPALLRPGRLDRRVEFGLPDLEGRAHILKIHAKSMSVERDIRYELIARLCPNATGAELRSVCTEAGMFAIRARRKVATEKDFLESVNKVIKGYQKFSSTPKSLVVNVNMEPQDSLRVDEDNENNSLLGNLDTETDFFKIFDLDDSISSSLEAKQTPILLEQDAPESNKPNEEQQEITVHVETTKEDPESPQTGQPTKAMNMLDERIEDDQELYDTHSFLESMQTLEISLDEAEKKQESQDRPQISLRKRKEIQLHPFTVEKLKFKTLLRGTSVRRMVSSVEPQNVQDLSDTEFVPDAVEVEEDASLDFQCTQSALEGPEREIRKPAEISGPKVVIEDELESVSSTSHMNQRETSNLMHEKKKSKGIVTYSKRRKNKSTPSRATYQKGNSDIFAFDPNPIIARHTEGSSHAMDVDDKLDAFEDILEKAPKPKSKRNDTGNISPVFELGNTDEGFDSMLVDDDDGDDDDGPVFLRRRRLRQKIDSDEEDEQDQHDHDSIFDFPDNFEPDTHPRRITSSITNDEDDIVPIVQDDFEYRPRKRRRFKVADLRKNNKILKRVLPISFLNVYRDELNEEEMRCNSSKSVKRTTITSKRKKTDGENRLSRLDQPFDAFLGSQSEYVNNDDIPTENNNMRHYGSETFRQRSRVGQLTGPSTIDRYFTNTVEAVEDNRIPHHSHRTSTQRSSHKATQANTSQRAPLKKKRRRPRRTMDDIYIHHQPTQKTTGYPRRFYQRTLDDIGISSKRVYNDDHITVQKPPVEWVRNIAEYLRSTKNAASLKPFPKYTQSLEEIIENIQRVFDPDLRCSIRLGDTVYLHHRLLQPLLSAKPNSKKAYVHLMASFENFQVFHRRIFWTNIEPSRKEFVQSLFGCARKEITETSTGMADDVYFDIELDEFPDLDKFCVFMSIYLTQWLPLQDPAHAAIMVELLGEEVRDMAYHVCNIVKLMSSRVNSWRLIVKIMLFILDWTCRLHLIGINESEWSVTQCTQMLIDILVTIGHECIITQEKPYVIEAWVCLLQIMTVSSNSGGYYFSDETFIRQLRHSIEHKSNQARWIMAEANFERETWWTNALSHILEKYML
ncbi:hypothetical protein G6F57_000078 [Rhizopus arrhizus]|uniref:26S proteasome regulatory subunit 7 homolog n=1 Tax=Rhizopus oryzae TaxID=64495 RepID=A0A9P6X1Y1_RHIOR|nr:hypothetical protein G6F30_000277 [Rhizopus arrhizus]KAG1420865.1 hypothetical protein G6F58_003999 [Rhizopus delemar]KAG0990162.1 hypothetical protein G6F29_000431 [Rhizopus arrhizus]KAG1000365.1 hypothetical protein G6F28_000146 [Rhizopus arrhizus]KAG1015174.1 hypothetical protein G6F27_000285 [Rhizopus arrhizus]